MIRKIIPSLSIVLGISLSITFASALSSAENVKGSKKDGKKEIEKKTIAIKGSKDSHQDSHPSLEELLMRISVDHPFIRSRASDLAAQMQTAGYAGTIYPDPKFGIYWLNTPYRSDLKLRPNETAMSGVELRIMQAIPFPGKLTIKAHVADARVETARIRLALAKNDIAMKFLMRYSKARMSLRLGKLAQSYAGRIRVVAETAKTRYSVGRGNLADVARADVRYSRYLERIENAKGELDGDRNELSYFVKPADYDTAKSPKIQIMIKPIQFKSYMRTIEKRLIANHEPLDQISLDTALAKTIIRVRDKQDTLARLDYFPDFEVFAAYRKRNYIENPNDIMTRRTAEDFVSAGINIRVPLWSALSTHKKIRARESSLKAGKFTLGAVRRRVKSTYRASERRLLSIRERLKMYANQLIPQAQQARDSAAFAYSTGLNDFSAFLDAWETLYMLRAERIRLQNTEDREIIFMTTLLNLVLPETKTSAKKEAVQ